MTFYIFKNTTNRCAVNVMCLGSCSSRDMKSSMNAYYISIEKTQFVTVVSLSNPCFNAVCILKMLTQYHYSAEISYRPDQNSILNQSWASLTDDLQFPYLRITNLTVRFLSVSAILNQLIVTSYNQRFAIRILKYCCNKFR